MSIMSQYNTHAAEYKKLAESVTYAIATAACAHLPPLTPRSCILDSACGTGTATAAVLRCASARNISPPPRVEAIDAADGMVAQYRERAAAEGWTTATARVLDSADLGAFADGTFDVVFMNFGLFFLADAGAAAAEIRRVLRPGGRALVTTWKEAGTTALLKGAVRAVKGSVDDMYPGEEAWSRSETVRRAVLDGGFRADRVWVEEAATQWEGLEEGGVEGIIRGLCTPLFAGMRKDFTEEENARFPDEVRKQLTPEQRETGRVDMIAWVCVAEKEA